MLKVFLSTIGFFGKLGLVKGGVEKILTARAPYHNIRHGRVTYDLPTLTTLHEPHELTIGGEMVYDLGVEVAHRLVNSL